MAEKLPVHESIKVLDSVTLSKNQDWWKAVTLQEYFGRKQVVVYLWQWRGNRWKRKNKLVIRGSQEWKQISSAVEKLLKGLEK